MAREPSYGLTAQNMKAIGVMVWPRVKAISITPTAMFTPASSIKTAQTALEFTCIKMDRRMKASGVMICKTDLERRS